MRHSRGVRELLVVAILTATSAFAQTPAEQQEYQAALAKPRGPEQVSALEKFAAAHPQSRLKIDALELLVWTARGSANVADLEYWTGQLLSVGPDNPLAAAVIIGDSLNISSENRVTYAKRTLPAIDRFDRPEGMSHDDFTAMKNFVTGTLNGIVGYSYYEQKDFNAARPYLRKAIEINPRNAQYTYTLALCDLQGPNPDQAEGYTMLARAVNLTQGTPAGDRLANFARQNFQQAGGSSENWNKYLAAAVVPPPQPTEAPAPVESASAATPAAAASATTPTASANAPVTGAPATSAPATSAPTNATAGTNPVANPASAPTTASSAPAKSAPTSAAPATSASAAPPTTPNISGGGGIGTPSSAAPASTASSSASAATTPVAPSHEPILVAGSGPSPALPNGTANPAAPPPAPAPAPAPAPDANRPLRVFPPRPPKHIAPGSPVSVGVLIQASLAVPANRKPVVFTLSDLVRHLRDKDEAFIMSFSRGVVFQEDLTSNTKSLETAMDDIAPTPGAAMYDAVTFAAGHLDRVAKNPNRILLVIAAEGDRDSTVSPLELSSEINLSGVTIYCIGVGVATPADQNRLEALADSTGGRAIFISDLSRFRDATKSIAQGLGIAFQ